MIEWFNMNQGFLMAFLTAIYVIATILILFSNRKSNMIMQESMKQNNEIQRKNAKLALFERRRKAYNELERLVVQVEEKDPKPPFTDDLYKVCQDIYYLFDDEVDDLIGGITDNIRRLHNVNEKQRKVVLHKKEKEDLRMEESSLVNAIFGELNRVTKLVHRYLDMGKLGVKKKKSD